MPAPDLLERIDRALAELQAIRDEVAASLPAPAAEGNDLDDLAADNLLDTTSAQERFGYPRNTLAKWCRTEGVGVLRGGSGVGLICGDPLIAADIDSDDESLGVELIDALTDSNGIVITKTGRRGQTLLLRPPPDVTVRSRKFLINGATVFEMLAEGRQTVLPPTI